MKTYKHLSQSERDMLGLLRAQGYSLRRIATYLKRSASSLSREIQRNKDPIWYRSENAHKKAQHRLRRSHRKPLRLKAKPELHRQVVQMLRNGWSPEIISAALKGGERKTVINPETIYRWIYSHDRSLIKHLVRSHAHRKPRHFSRWPKRILDGRLSIRLRPDFINRRLVPGHWETDLIWGKGQSALQVLVERKTRFVRIRRIPDKTAQTSFRILSALFSEIPMALRQTITYDNGGENSLHEYLNRSFGLKSYFCEPFHAWEKGTIENTNGLIRRFFPKGFNFDTIPNEKIQDVEHWLNNRPRKCLKFQTSADAFRFAARCTSS